MFEGSFELSKLREAIMGKNGNNLDDLARMDGKMKHIVTAQQQPQPQQQNNHNCSWVETSNLWEYHHHHTNSKLHDRAKIEQNSENKSY